MCRLVISAMPYKIFKTSMDWFRCFIQAMPQPLFNVDVKDGEKTVNRKVGSNALALSKPPLVRLEYGNLIRATKAISGNTGLLGWINSLSWNPSLDMGMFTNGDSHYPKVISLSIDFTVQHEHELGNLSRRWRNPHRISIRRINNVKI